MSTIAGGFMNMGVYKGSDESRRCKVTQNFGWDAPPFVANCML